MKKIFGILALVISIFFISCNSDDPTQSSTQTSSNSSAVTINPNNTTSSGVIFSQIDETTFFLDFIKYKIVDAHLEIVGYDKLEIAKDIKPYAFVTYRGTTYPTRVIYFRAFADCNTIKTVDLPSTLIEIGQQAFSGCKGLTDIKFPDDLKIIGSAAFSSCTGLSEISFPNGLKEISDWAFGSCTSLTEITFPAELEIIGYDPFYNLELKKVTFLGTIPPKPETYYHSTAFSDWTLKNAILYVPKESIDLYKKRFDFDNIQGF